MGSPVSAVVENLYTEIFVELALESAPSRARLWKQIHVASLGKVTWMGSYITYSIHLTIEFTIEVEEGGSLPFLDTKITMKTDGKFDITVYRKQMHTDRYLHLGLTIQHIWRGVW